MSDSNEGPVVLFDGVCNLCHGAVHFLLDRERTDALRFAALQSPAGEALLLTHGRGPIEGDPDSMYLVEGGRFYERSTAVLRISRYLRFPYRLAPIFLIIPRFLRDPLYRFVARNRYRWFGRTETCRIPTPELRARFL